MLEFDSLNHKYYEDGRELISVTTLLKKHGLSSDYSMVNETVLKKESKTRYCRSRRNRGLH